MTERETTVLRHVARYHRSAPDRWYRAGDSHHGESGRGHCVLARCGSGERVTLAALHRKGLLVRQAHRGLVGDADAAYEYRLSPEVVSTLTDNAVNQLLK